MKIANIGRTKIPKTDIPVIVLLPKSCDCHLPWKL
jgi:hypothetical protein